MLNVKRVQIMATRRLRSDDANKMVMNVPDGEEIKSGEVPITPERRPLNARPTEALPKE